MELELFFNRLETAPHTIEFPDVVALINRHYVFTPTAFTNDEIVNEAGHNSGACRVFAFARLHDLDVEKTLALFGSYYRADVSRDPDGSRHANIRQFMITGWDGIVFEGIPLRARPHRSAR